MYSAMTPNCLDQWVRDYQEFHRALMYFVQPVVKVVGYQIQTDSDALRAAHAAWCANCRLWEETRLMPNSNGLSHIKMMALLIFALAQFPWIKSLHEFDYEGSADAREYEYNGTEQQRQETRRDIAAGRGAFLGYQFAISVIIWFEQGRTDKRGPFLFRMTHDMEHDFLVYLCSEAKDEMAVFLILKALFLRDDVGHGPVASLENSNI